MTWKVISSLSVALQVLLQSLAVARHGEAEDEIDQADGDEGFQTKALPGRLDHSDLRRGQKVENADDQYEAGVLEKADEGVFGKPTSRPTCSSTSTTSAPRKLKRTSIAGENRLNVSTMVRARSFRPVAS